MPAGSSGWAQVGRNEGKGEVRSYTIGVGADLPWQTRWGAVSVQTSLELSVARWLARDAPEATDAFTQAGITPVARLQLPDHLPRLFVDLGVGANLIWPIFGEGSKRFSSAFNFGDHFAIGALLGAQSNHELSARIQHFSNAGLKEPNPGENFIQVRYAYRWN